VWARLMPRQVALRVVMSRCKPGLGAASLALWSWVLVQRAWAVLEVSV
jgi:hypothetical protein